MKLLPLFLLAPLTTVSLIPNKVPSLLWINEQGTTLTQLENGYAFTSSTRGDSARTNTMVNLNGLTFNYSITNASVGQVAGFYFNTDGSHNLDNNKCTFTFAPGFDDGRMQTRFGIYPTDKTNDWFNKSYLPLNQTGVVGKYGFGLDSTLVMNFSIALKVQFSFKKIGPYYRLIIRELASDLIWHENANYTSDPAGNYVYTYIEETNIPTQDGKVYIHEFAYSSSTAPTVRIENIVEQSSEYTTVTYHYNLFVKDGEDGVPKVITETVPINSLLEKPNDPTKQNYYFAGWYSDLYFKNKWDFENDIITDELDLYAKWVTDPSEINPKEDTKTSTTKAKVIQISMFVFVAGCIVLGLIFIGLCIFLYWLIKKLILKKRGSSLLK